MNEYEETLKDLDEFAKLHFKCKRGIYVGCAIKGKETSYSATFNHNRANLCNGKEGACGCVHAEAHCIISCLQRYSFDLLKFVPLTLFVTVQPCLFCAQLICLSRIIDKVVYMRRDDRDLSGIEYIKAESPNIGIVEVRESAKATN